MQISLGPWILDPGFSLLLWAALTALHFRYGWLYIHYQWAAKKYSNPLICPNFYDLFRVKIDEPIALLILQKEPSKAAAGSLHSQPANQADPP